MEKTVTGFLVFLLLVGIGCSVHTSNTLPLQISPVISASCPSATMRGAIRQGIQNQVRSLLRDEVVPSIRSRPSCPCGGPGEWRRIAHLNMSDHGESCPANWTLTFTPRGCGRSSTGESCDSTFFPSNGSYSQICGRIAGIQKGSPDGFVASANVGLDGAYLDGVSLTHGAAGSRQHIWSFAATQNDQGTTTGSVCLCTGGAVSVPSYVRNDYFCASGNRGPGRDLSAFYPDDPLWDGEGCGPTNACCEFNNPPWFCTSLPQPTTDALEVRICLNQDFDDEEILVTLIDIYIK